MLCLEYERNLNKLASVERAGYRSADLRGHARTEVECARSREERFHVSYVENITGAMSIAAIIIDADLQWLSLK